jgi:uncharacterized protein YjiS (DUF1127 family)
MMTPLEGRCLCGAVRYRIEAEPLHADYGHGRMCQRSTGAPVVAWLTAASAAFAWTRGDPSIYRSSPEGERLFCGTCGTQMVFRARAEPHLVDVTLASLDDTATVRPGHHLDHEPHRLVRHPRRAAALPGTRPRPRRLSRTAAPLHHRGASAQPADARLSAALGYRELPKNTASGELSMTFDFARGLAQRRAGHFALRLRRAVDLLLTWHARARQRRQLCTLNDRMLRDIGLTRADVLAESSKPFWRL